MKGVARIDDLIEGTTSGEHSGHTDSPHDSLPITGFIHSNCSDNVFANSMKVATVGSITEEHDDCCGVSYGVVSGGSQTVFVNGKPIARVDDSVSPHNGTAFISTGSSNVFSG